MPLPVHFPVDVHVGEFQFGTVTEQHCCYLDHLGYGLLLSERQVLNVSILAGMKSRLLGD